jgi:hypothetical protein
MEIKIAAVGDIHGAWSEADNAYFNAAAEYFGKERCRLQL